jgi:hypothetical protein
VVGRRRDYSHWLGVLVDGLPQRLVLVAEWPRHLDKFPRLITADNLQIGGASLIITRLFGVVTDFRTIIFDFIAA